jgi:hypothetical protein
MQGRREETEVIVRLDQLDGFCHINVSMWPAMARKMTKLYGPSLDARRGGNSLRWKVPLKGITFRSQKAIEAPRRKPVGGFKPRARGQFEKTSAAAGTSAS